MVALSEGVDIHDMCNVALNQLTSGNCGNCLVADNKLGTYGCDSGL